MTWTGLTSLLALVAVFVFAFATCDEKPWANASIGTLVAAAAAFAGAVIGFIFGVPRSTGAAAGSTTPNTNLEQISDWLTKILVGVGLTQFPAIAEAAGRLFAALAPAFGGDGRFGGTFAGALIIFMFAFGFSDGWLFTRLFLGGAMTNSDRDARVHEYMDEAKRAEEEGRPGAARVWWDMAQELNRGVLPQRPDDTPEGTAPPPAPPPQ
ncbi:hypothetical protein ACIBI7_35720 [Nonomuraea fuscirosea]|uniref:hypothetical protein n=1 Tax=Nonomuraea fuscirosea TaxID=1291556 RepID=UPI0037A4C872